MMWCTSCSASACSRSGLGLSLLVQQHAVVQQDRLCDWSGSDCCCRLRCNLVPARSGRKSSSTQGLWCGRRPALTNITRNRSLLFLLRLARQTQRAAFLQWGPACSQGFDQGSSKQNVSGQQQTAPCWAVHWRNTMSLPAAPTLCSTAFLPAVGFKKYLHPRRRSPRTRIATRLN